MLGKLQKKSLFTIAVAAAMTGCGTSHGTSGSGGSGAMPEHGLLSEDGGQIVYDSNQDVYWLADANLAGDPAMRAQMGVSGINPNGTMDYATAQAWVKALNAKGYLGHSNWQLPVMPPNDATCSSDNMNNFGVGCTGSALGNLYSVGLARTWPDSAVPGFTSTVAPFQNLQPSLYWTSDSSSGGEKTFSFGLDLVFSNTTRYNYFPLLPMVQGAIGAKPPGSGVVPYPGGAAAGKAVYDTATQVTWALDANLAASEPFGETGMTTIMSAGGKTYTAPLVDAGSGTMLYDTTTPWLAAMNQSGYAGTSGWILPHASDLQTLFADLGLHPGDDRLTARGDVGPFKHLQPFFYWACMRDQAGSSQSPCNGQDAGKNMQGVTMDPSFDFNDGFEGTDEDTKQFFVLVYYPAGK
jgi:hypothetical protein